MFRTTCCSGWFCVIGILKAHNAESSHSCCSFKLIVTHVDYDDKARKSFYSLIILLITKNTLNQSISSNSWLFLYQWKLLFLYKRIETCSSSVIFSRPVCMVKIKVLLKLIHFIGHYFLHLVYVISLGMAAFLMPQWAKWAKHFPRPPVRPLKVVISPFTMALLIQLSTWVAWFVYLCFFESAV